METDDRFHLVGDTYAGGYVQHALPSQRCLVRLDIAVKLLHFHSVGYTDCQTVPEIGIHRTQRYGKGINFNFMLILVTVSYR